ncbi:RTA1 like protein-domain-containing protein [Fusarium oxysporum Fo47]|uniref:RTA1 like protein-domain-containing protein n=1 Tax=Fusarium oxysporum Fo47 TaxID=660027 RepID=UPI002869D533|nr:RTA1 like protein-domain-containing protein [Fusarium oxysporum Fo47]QKD50565.2 RTA1 like protein-domain-containing protein [Fusarium oxysporum Fo47]
MPRTCHALEVTATKWDFFFALATFTHAVQAVRYRKPYCWTIAMSGLLQTLAYLFRILSIESPASLGPYAAWFVLILIAPIWNNAFVYMILGRMVWTLSKAGKVLGLSAWRVGYLSVVLDKIAAVVQIYGAATASDTNVGNEVILRGLHIYMAGIAIQQLFICIFSVIAICFHRDTSVVLPRNALLLLYCLYFAVILISTRIIFRLIEYSGGLNSSIPRHEAYQYCLDSLLMLIASCVLNIVHPGRVMPGKQGDLPNKAERKLHGITPEACSDRILLSNQVNENA